MGVLNPLLLLLGAAAAVPLLLHLLQRHQGPRVLFPALRYLRRAEKESARRIRLRQILLMLLRVAAVLLLAFAAARPFVRLGGSGHSPTAVVIVLDNSMSTGAVEGDRRVLDELRERALEVLGDATPDDRFWLLRAGTPGEPALAGDAETTARRVRETEPSAAGADIPSALVHARALLAAGSEGRAQEIHVLTDLQASAFGAVGDVAGTIPPVILWHPGRPAPANRAVAEVELGGGAAPVAGQRSTLAAAISGAGEDRVNLRLTIDGRLTAAGSARAGETTVLALPPRPAGPVSGHVEIDADALRADDRRYFAGRVLPPPTVVLSEPAPFLTDALEVLAEAGRISRGGAVADVAVLAGGAGAEARGSETAVVVLPPVNPAELPAANRRLAGAGIPWRFDPPAAGEARFATGDGDGDPLLRSLSDVRLRQVYGLTAVAATADSVLLRTRDGAAWAVRGERRVGGTYVLLASPLTEEASTLPTSAAMLPLLDRIISAWSMPAAAGLGAAPGEEVALPPGATAVRRPDGTVDAVSNGAAIRLGAEPGIYTVLGGDSAIAAYAVNAPSAESDLRRLDAAALRTRLPGWTLHITDDARAWRRAAFRERLGRELWRPLLYALVLVLIVESIAAAAGRSRSAAAARMSEAAPG
jgi:hypothetical protein